LYGAIALGILAAILEHCSQASGPTDYDYCICLIYNNSYSKSGTLESAMGMIIATFMLVGIFQIILDLKDRRLYKIFSISCCFWFYDRRRFNNYSVPNFSLCRSDISKTTIRVIQDIGSFFSNFNPAAFAIGGATVLIYYIFPKVTKLFQAHYALVVASLIAYF
jgi:SulP family sulfate permease